MMLEPGHAHALGATLQSGGVNFCLAAPHAQAVELCLFDATGISETARAYLPACTDGMWHGFLPGDHAGLVYGWRVHGPWAPQQGHRFNPAKVVLDPYAREVVGSYQGQDLFLGYDASNPELPDTRDNAAMALKARVVTDLPAPVPGPVVDPAQRVLYELHIKGFTALHPDVPIKLRGSYAGKTKIVITIREAADEDGATKKHLYFEGVGEIAPAPEPAPVTGGSPSGT